MLSKEQGSSSNRLHDSAQSEPPPFRRTFDINACQSSSSTNLATGDFFGFLAEGRRKINGSVRISQNPRTWNLRSATIDFASSQYFTTSNCLKTSFILPEKTIDFVIELVASIRDRQNGSSPPIPPPLPPSATAKPPHHTTKMGSRARYTPSGDRRGARESNGQIQREARARSEREGSQRRL